MEPDDAEVVARARGGDDEAFRALVECHSRALFRLAWRITGSEQDAEDVVQDTFIKAYRNLGAFESRANFGTWLRRIATNGALDIARSRKRWREATPPGERGESWIDPFDSIPGRLPAPDHILEQGDFQRRLRAAMAMLSPKERGAFVLRHFEHQTIEEIGRTMGIAENATKQSIFRAVRKLRRALEPLAASVRTRS